MTQTTPNVPSDFLQDWSRHPATVPLAQRSYVARELVRIARAGAPVISAVLTAPLEIQQQLGLSVLRDHVVWAEAELRPKWRVALAPGVAPLPYDPQGRDVPDGKRGKVLVVKVGTIGGGLAMASTQYGSETLDAFGGEALMRRSLQKQNLYRCVEIGFEPTELELDEAITALRKYGVGIQSQEMIHRPIRRYEQGPDGMLHQHMGVVKQSQHLLIEMPQPWADKPAAAADPKRKAA